MAACEPAAPIRGVCRENLLKQRVQSATLLKKVVLDTISCVKRPRQRLNNSLVNWRKRKRHRRKTVRMASWETRYLRLWLPPIDIHLNC
ncbi:hypothetical protein Bpfe_011189 [Biomphalaria pfeifferi]|uniref:Uncharacterized protein n=1 Tax=Biomphalaria pfeifferi TaxID=112525 RepID=A0AAD8FCK1_BIOPF|nr:hypothetical protein Bpfe_011189 [Biomphalaria pfeifferi]